MYVKMNELTHKNRLSLFLSKDNKTPHSPKRAPSIFSMQESTCLTLKKLKFQAIIPAQKLLFNKRKCIL